MSYQVIALKWRPQTFEEVIGQLHATRTLQNAIRLERIAHAYLFSGARGVGKTSIARILAKALNCERGLSPTPCNQCSNCREISHTNSVDVIEIDGASNRGIDNIRELRETVRYRPAKGRYKVYIIDEVHMLTTEAFNALLKTLEEPPPHVVFILATTEPHKIPATILSRCQRFDFRRLSLQQIVEHLKRIASQEKADFSEGLLYAVAREADGSMRDAQSLLEQLLAFSGDELPEAEILDILGVIDRQSVLRTADAILSGNTQACLGLVADVYGRGMDSRRFCQHLCDHFRNLLFMTISAGSETRLDLPEDEKKLLEQQAAGTSPESLHVYFQMLLRGEEEIRRSSMPKIALEMLLLRMAQLPRLESVDAVLDRIEMIERGLKNGHAASDCGLAEGRSGFETESGARKTEETAAPSPPSSTPPSVPASKAVEDWHAFVAFLQNHDPILWAKISHCAVKASGEVLELEVPDIFEKSTNGSEFIRKLEDASQAFFGSRLQWIIRTKSSRTSRSGATQGRKAGKPSGAKQIVGHPAVQQAIEILGAELIEVKPSKGVEPEGSPGGKKSK